MKIELTTEDIERLCKCIYFSTFEDDNVNTAEFHSRRMLFNKLYNALRGIIMTNKIRTALSERPQGEWIVKSNGTTNYYACDKCGSAGDIQDKFCRECGANMRGTTND